MNEEQEDQEDQEDQGDQEAVDLKPISDFIKKVGNSKMDIKTIIIIILFLLLALITFIYYRDIAACNTYYNEIMNKTISCFAMIY